MTRLRQLFGDARGSAAIEFSIAAPVLVLFMWGFFQFGMLFEANAGMQHALGEGARYATLYDPSTTNHIPSDTNIKSKITSSIFQPAVGTFTVATPVDGTNYRDLSVTYAMPLSFIFFNGPTVTLSASKRVYVVSS
jgi:Flp pilus assembly protein TadG